MKTRHPIFYVINGALIAIGALLLAQSLRNSGNTKTFWLSTSIALAISIFGISILLAQNARRLSSKL